MAFVNDTFTDVSGTAIQSHTGETGATWTLHSSYGTAAAGAVITSENRVRYNVASGRRLWYASGTPSASEYDVAAQVVIKTAPSGFTIGVVGRVDTTVNTYYVGEYVEASGFWRLAKCVNGTITALGTYAQTLTAGSTYSVTLQIRDATKKLLIDGVERISSTDNSITAAGKAGVIFGTASIAPTNTTGPHLDTFNANETASSVSKTATDSVAFSDTGVSNQGLNGITFLRTGQLPLVSPNASAYTGQTDYTLGTFDAGTGAGRALIVGAVWRHTGGVVSKLQYGGVDLQPVLDPNPVVDPATGTATMGYALYVLSNPPSGSNALVAQVSSNTSNVQFIADVAQGLDGGTPFGDASYVTGTGTTPNIAGITGQPGGVIVGLLAHRETASNVTVTEGANQTRQAYGDTSGGGTPNTSDVGLDLCTQPAQSDDLQWTLSASVQFCAMGLPLNALSGVPQDASKTASDSITLATEDGPSPGGTAPVDQKSSADRFTATEGTPEQTKGGVYYLDPSGRGGTAGNDSLTTWSMSSRNNTPARPFATWPAALKAVAAAGAGSTLLVRAYGASGTDTKYPTGILVDGINPSDYIFVKAYPGDNVQFAAGTSITINNSSFIRWEGFKTAVNNDYNSSFNTNGCHHFQFSGWITNRCHWVLNGLHDFLWEDCYLGAGGQNIGSCIHIRGKYAPSGWTNFNNIVARRCRFDWSTNDLFHMDSILEANAAEGCIVEDCIFTRCIFINLDAHSDSIQLACATKGFKIRRNLFYGVSGKGIILMPTQHAIPGDKNHNGENCGDGRHEDMEISDNVFFDCLGGSAKIYNAPRLVYVRNTHYTSTKQTGSGPDLYCIQGGVMVNPDTGVTMTKATHGTQGVVFKGNILHWMRIGGNEGTNHGASIYGVYFADDPNHDDAPDSGFTHLTGWNIITSTTAVGEQPYQKRDTDVVMTFAQIAAMFNDVTYDSAKAVAADPFKATEFDVDPRLVKGATAIDKGPKGSDAKQMLYWPTVDHDGLGMAGSFGDIGAFEYGGTKTTDPTTKAVSASEDLKLTDSFKALAATPPTVKDSGRASDLGVQADVGGNNKADSDDALVAEGDQSTNVLAAGADVSVLDETYLSSVDETDTTVEVEWLPDDVPEISFEPIAVSESALIDIAQPDLDVVRLTEGTTTLTLLSRDFSTLTEGLPSIATSAADTATLSEATSLNLRVADTLGLQEDISLTKSSAGGVVSLSATETFGASESGRVLVAKPATTAKRINGDGTSTVLPVRVRVGGAWS